MRTIGFLYFGRLDSEKGYDAILDMCNHFGKDKEVLPFDVFVFGSGRYEKKTKQASTKRRNFYYFGRQPLSVISRYIKNCHYCLMPSHFLETFGLSAVNALAWWLPVIWYKKWGSKPFVLDDYNLWSYAGTAKQQLVGLVNKLLHDDPLYGENTQNIQNIVQEYSYEKWLEKIKVYLGDAEKVLLVSDFADKIGGIETYIHDVQELLISAGYEVEIAGARNRWWKVRQRYLGFVISMCNVWFGIELKKTIKSFEPDIIRYHSISRYIGRLPLYMTKNMSWKKRIMYHDLWLFHPFPHAVIDEKQLTKAWWLIDRIRSSKSKNPLVWIAIMGKRISVRILQTSISEFDLQLVPSSFLHKYAKKFNNIKTTVLPHFIQIKNDE